MRVIRAKRLIFILSVLGVVCALLIRDELISAILTLACTAVCVGVLYRFLPELSHVSASNPKAKTLRFVTAFNMVIVLSFIVFAVLVEKEIITLSEEGEALLPPIIFAVFILVFGNIAPKLPFNRYTGLRLPWTVRDEETWLLAHRILGYLSLPCGVLCLAGIGKQRAALYIPMAMLLVWILVPAVLSLVFYYKKWRS